MPRRARDKALVNGWGLAATATGPWWTTNEASDTSTLYSGSGRKQVLTVSVPGGPTGIAVYDGRGFRVSAGGVSDPARFIYACEDGKIRAWTPTVPHKWSAQTEIVVDGAGEAAIFRGVAVARRAPLRHRLPQRARRCLRLPLAAASQLRGRVHATRRSPPGTRPTTSSCSAATCSSRTSGARPSNGNDDPTGGYVDEFDLAGRLVARVGRMGVLNEPWGLALAPSSFGRYRGDLLVANFGDGHVNAFRQSGGRWASRRRARRAGRQAARR